MSAGEIIDVINEDGQVIKAVPRDEAERDNHITQNVLIFVFNSLGKVWTQLRPKTKVHHPGLWDISACGYVLSRESRARAAHRETFEETTLENLDLQYIESFLNIFAGESGKVRRRLSHLYVGISDEIPQPNPEVERFESWEVAQLRIDIIENPAKYVPPFLVELDRAVAGYENLTGKSLTQ